MNIKKLVNQIGMKEFKETAGEIALVIKNNKELIECYENLLKWASSRGYAVLKLDNDGVEDTIDIAQEILLAEDFKRKNKILLDKYGVK
jgi:hypothetical protein